MLVGVLSVQCMNTVLCMFVVETQKANFIHIHHQYIPFTHMLEGKVCNTIYTFWLATCHQQCILYINACTVVAQNLYLYTFVALYLKQYNVGFRYICKFLY